MEKNIIIGTAGHIDHGKSTLIKALTGEETDRLEAEKKRGISIEPGFSHLETEKTKEKNLKLGIVDVPGHEKFVNKMLSTAAGVDLALIIVAADEGVMPQTKEHLSILDLLGVEKAIVVLNKIDLVEEEWLELIEEDLKEHLTDTFAEKAEIIKISALKEKGIDTLKEKIIEIALNMKKRKKSSLSYYPIDRVFSLKGQGTVVTGTLFSGKLKKGEELFLYPAEKELKIRSLESHGKQYQKINAGSRVGINLSGLDKAEINKGDIIAAKNSLIKTKFFEGELKILKELNFSVKNGDQIHFHTAALETTGRIYLYNKKEAFPGEKVYIKLILNEEIALFFKQKYIIRRFSPLQTIGGGEILELDPPPRRKKPDKKITTALKRLGNASPTEAVEIFIEKNEMYPAKLDFLKKKTALKTEDLKEILNNLAIKGKIVELLVDKSYIHKKVVKKIENEILKILNSYHHKNNLRSGIKKEELRSRLNFDLNKKEMDSLIEVLIDKEILKENNNLIAKADFKITLSEEKKKKKNNIINDYQSKLFNPPSRQEIIDKYNLEADFFDYLENKGILIRLSADLYFHHSVFRETKKLLLSFFKENESLSLGEFRDLINSSRRYALPLLEKIDRLKITEREGELRYPGEKLKNSNF